MPADADIFSGRPWNVDMVIELADGERALRFERYLKSGSGVAFAKRHLSGTKRRSSEAVSAD